MSTPDIRECGACDFKYKRVIELANHKCKQTKKEKVSTKIMDFITWLENDKEIYLMRYYGEKDRILITHAEKGKLLEEFENE